MNKNIFIISAVLTAIFIEFAIGDDNEKTAFLIIAILVQGFYCLIKQLEEKK